MILLVVLVIPAGLGINFTWKRKWRFGFEINWRTTFTDYIDDVSQFYANPSTLPNATSIQIADKSGELLDSERPPVENYGPGEKRGDPTRNDTYFTANFTVGKLLVSKSKFSKSKHYWSGKRRGKFFRTKRAKF